MAALDERCGGEAPIADTPLSPRPVCLVEGLTFAYPGREDEPVLHGVSLEVPAGAFCVITGPTGCGKTTLLRCLKPELAPAGVRSGYVEVLGRVLAGDGARGPLDLPEPSGELGPHGGPAAVLAPTDGRWSVTNIGFVMQDPAAQIVCDTVWHELAFGLENIGMPQDQMRRRIAEVAHFFGIEPIMHAATETLSGGQQQLVNLAAVLALRPRLLVLDEPTAQLDPNAQREFLFLLGRVNRELGITVIVSTHTPEATDAYATQRIELGNEMPLGTRAELEAQLAPRWDTWEAQRGGGETDPVLTVRDLHIRYDRDEPWVLRGIDLAVARGCVHAIVGGNGCGKSTLLKALAGIIRPQRGRVRNALAARQAYLPQDPQALLVCDTVAEELGEWTERCGYGPVDIARVSERLGLTDLESRHPGDLSGGQQQKLALAKLLLTQPDLLFLDEPTKGLDPAGTAEMVRILRGLAESGRTVVMVTHDLDVALAVADEVSMVFDGEIACTESARLFFAENLVYRPHEASRLFGMLLGEAGGAAAGRRVDEKAGCDVHAAGAEPSAPPAAHQAPSAVRQTAANLRAPRFDSHAARNRDARPAEPSLAAAPAPSLPQPNLFRGIIEAVALLAVPIALVAAGLTGFSQTALLSFAVVIAALAVFFASYETGGARLREIMPTVVLAALAAAGRIVFAALPSIKPVSAIAVIAGAVLGRRSGFMVGALAALASNFFFGQGPWTPWQMYAWGLVGYGAGVLARLGLFGRGIGCGNASHPEAENAPGSRNGPDGAQPRSTRAHSALEMLAICAYGFMASVAYGWILNAWSILGFLHAHIGFEVLAVYAASLPFDVAHGLSTVVFLLVLYAPWRRRLARTIRRYGL